jgi:hypothetical protein
MTGSMLFAVAEIPSTALPKWHLIPARASGAIYMAAFNVETS